MTALLDVDQLRTFVAIAETGSFTRAAEVVHKTQSAVSMQMKRLEERIGRPIFVRDGRASRLTPDGERLLDYALRLVKLNLEAISTFTDAALSGHVCLGVPDDYADRYLPDIMARFSRTHPSVELTVICEPSVELAQRIAGGTIDLAIITATDNRARDAKVIRRERLLWVSSARHAVHLETPVPLALGRPTCIWRDLAISNLNAVNRANRLLYSSPNAGAVAAAVLAGLAVSVFPESALRPGMRVLGPSDGFPPLPPCDIGLMRNRHEPTVLADALASHIIQGLSNLDDQQDAAE